MCPQTSAFVPALQKIPEGAAKAAAARSSAKGKGGEQKGAEDSKAAKTSKAAAPMRGKRGAPKAAAAGMISQLGRRLLHMRIMLCELMTTCLTELPVSHEFHEPVMYMFYMSLPLASPIATGHSQQAVSSESSLKA